MSGVPLDPGKSTVYIANLPYDLSKMEIEKIFNQYGEVVKVTLLTVKETRISKGVAFVLFRNPEDAEHCVKGANNTRVNENIIRASIARDNGQRPNLERRNFDKFPRQHNPRY